MNAIVKLIIGLLIAVAGIYWYLADFIGKNVLPAVFGTSAIGALKTIFIGLFGL